MNTDPIAPMSCNDPLLNVESACEFTLFHIAGLRGTEIKVFKLEEGYHF